KAFRGELDVTKLSYHAFAHVISQYALLDAGSALGFGVGPLLIAPPRPSRPTPLSSGASSRHDAESDGPAEVADTDRIGIPGRYTTANLLLGLAFPTAQSKKEM